MQYVAVGMAVLSAYKQVQYGDAQKEAYESQAKYKQLEGRVEAVRSKEQGNAVLKAVNRRLANINASIGRRGVGLGGSTQTFITQQVMRPGILDFNTAQSNAKFAQMMANTEAENLKFAGKQAKLQGQIGAVTTLGQGVMNYQKLGGPKGGTG